MRRTPNLINRERHELLHSMLEERRRDIQEKLRFLRETLPTESADVRDPEEQSVDDFIHDVDFALMEMKSETLRRIDDALGRLDEGRYGLCGECSAEISASRLRALPFAELCRDCQDEREKEERESHAAAARAPRSLDASTN